MKEQLRSQKRPKNMKHAVFFDGVFFFKKKKTKSSKHVKEMFHQIIIFQVFWEERNKKKDKTQRRIPHL